MGKREQTVCFTGHRNIPEPVEVVEARVAKIAEDLIRQGYRYFYAGGARGFDALASRVVLRLQEKYPDVELLLALPFPDQYLHESGWSESDIAEYHRLRDAATHVTHLQEAYSSGCYYRRNRYMVDASSVCVSYRRSIGGGTAYTVRYAFGEGLQVINCAGAA